MKITLFRSCTINDKRNKFCLKSKNVKPLTNKQVLQEFVSHELNSSTGRGIFYSFSTNLELVKNYHTLSGNVQICYIDIDLSNKLPSTIKGLYPVYCRDYVMCLIANTPDVLSAGKITNPETNRSHTIPGVLNYSQRSVCAWAYSLREIVLQCDELQLHPIEEWDNIAQDEDEVDFEIKSLCCIKPEDKNIEKLRKIMKESFEKTDLKRKYLLDRVNGCEWYTAS